MAMMSAGPRLLRTDLPELMRTCSVPGRRQLMWPLKSITSARSIIESASASCCFSSWVVMAVSMVVVMMAVAVLMGVILVVVVVFVLIEILLGLPARLRPARVLAEDE